MGQAGGERIAWMQRSSIRAASYRPHLPACSTTSASRQKNRQDSYKKAWILLIKQV
jgi:hypothetical protein